MDQSIIFYNNGGFWADEEEYELALLCFSLAIKADPHFLAAYGQRGLCLFEMELFEEALEDLNLYIDFSLEKGKERAISLYNRGLVFTELGRYDEAVRDFEKALEIMPEYLGITISKAQTESMMGNFMDSVLDYGRVLDLSASVGSVFLMKQVKKNIVIDLKNLKESKYILPL